MKLCIFTPNQLQGIIDEATVDMSEEQWHSNFLKNIAKYIKSKPIVYRSFGPFWWPLKKYLQDEELIDGEPVDETLFNQVTMGSRTLDLAAAFAFQDTISHRSTSHTVMSDEGDMIDYLVIDEEMES